MTLTIQYVPVNYAAQTWPLVEKYIEMAMEYGHGDYTVDQIKMFVNIGQWLLLIARDEEGNIHGAATSSFINIELILIPPYLYVHKISKL